MDLSLALLLLWGLLFVPPGIAIHWLVLGPGARARALPVAPVTGTAAAVLVLAALGRAGVDGGDVRVAILFVVVSLACVVAIWRGSATWRSRELVGAGLLLLFAVVLLQLPVVGQDGEGPLGYGTPANPVREVAAIEAAAGGASAGRSASIQARETAVDRPIGFEQFAGMTVGLGSDGSPDTAREATWSAYGLHAAITAMLAALVTLPLYAFARARGVRWLGLVALVPLGVLAPLVFLAIANGQGAAVASLPFMTAAVFSLLVTRRDRGWWALVVIFGAAVAATVGPLGLLPLVTIGLAWMFLRSDTYEHLSQHDTPVAPLRTLAATGAAAGLGLFASLPLLVGSGELLAWPALHAEVVDALRSWPFAWLDSDLSTAGPRGPLETAIWLIGPALLAVAVIYAIVRNERRELAVLVGALVAALAGAAVALVDERAGIRLFEFVMLSTSPFLAALAIRAVALARENADSGDSSGDSAPGRLAGTGPTALVLVFVVLSFAATAVTGTRMVHAPFSGLAAAAPGGPRSGSDGPAERTLIAAGDPWLELVVDGERVVGGYADADAFTEPGNKVAARGTRVEGYDVLLLSSSPLASDPPLRYLEQDENAAYQVRTFRDASSATGRRPSQDARIDTARALQRAKAAAALGADAARGAAADEGDGDGRRDPQDGAPDASTAIGATDEVAGASLVARRHDPVEARPRSTRPADPAGLLLPSSDVPGCGFDAVQTTCAPAAPQLDGTDCGREEVDAARAVGDDTQRAGAGPANGSEAADATDPQVVSVGADPGLPAAPALLGVQCFDVPIDPAAEALLLHLRDVGHILSPADAELAPARAWERVRGAGNAEGQWQASVRDSRATFGDGRLIGQYDVTLEGSFGAGLVATSSQQLDPALVDAQVPAPPLATIRGSADGFSAIERGVQLDGSLTFTNEAGTDVSLGRLFARPRDLPPSCDIVLPIRAGAQRELRLDVPGSDGASSREYPGVTATITSIRGTGEDRVARIVVGSYLSRLGVPRHVLVDWTEQFDEGLAVEGCDGRIHSAGGGTGAGDQVVADDESLEAFGQERVPEAVAPPAD